MRFYARVLLTIFCLTSTLLFASTPNIDSFAVENDHPMKVQQRTLSEHQMQLELQITNANWCSVGEEGVEAVLLRYPLAGAVSEYGKPSVPSVGRMFRIPPQAGLVVEVLNAEYETYTDVEYAAFIGNELDEIFAPCENPVDEWYPGELAKAGEPAILHDFRVGNLVTYPVQVNTARREVRVYSHIDVEIRFEGVDNRNTLDHWPTQISEAFLPAYRLFMDWNEDELDEYELYRGHVQVVMVDDEVLWETLAPWIEWKRQRGWILDFLTDSDIGSWTGSAIQNELEERYEAADPKFDYVAIIGDDEGPFTVPAGSYETGPGDQPYSELVGNDALSDVGVGRISVENVQQLNNYVAKVFNYERTPYRNDISWYLRGMVNRSDDLSGLSKIMSLRYYRHALLDLGYTQVDTSFGQGNAEAINHINNGVSFYGARGVYGTGLQGGDIDELNNDYMTPVVIDVTCGTGNWSEDTSISEHYMRAGTVAVPTGGICGMSMATSYTMTDFNNCLTGGSGWAMLQLGMPALGDMILMGKINGWNNYSVYDPENLAYFLRWYNLIGDPTVWTWIGIPEQLMVNVDDNIELGENSVTVIVQDEDGFIADALVTFYKYSNGEEIQVTKLTDLYGRVTLDVPVRETGDAMLTVIKHHYAPVQVEIDVTGPDARVGWVDIDFIDDGTGGTSGDGDGIPDAGETVGLQMVLKNYGTSTLHDINVTADEAEEWITNLSGSITLEELDANELDTGEGLILVEIASEAQHDWILHLGLNVETTQGVFDDACEITVQAPAYAFVSLVIGGDFDPGLTREVQVGICNIGGDDASASEASLFSYDPMILIEQGNCALLAMDINDVAEGEFSIRAHENAIPGYVGRFYMQVTTNDGQVDTIGIPVQIGSKESTDPNGPDNYGYYAFDNTDTGYPNFAPQYVWVEINPQADDPDYAGQSLNLDDSGENDDSGITIDLPFEVQYYGNTFEEISISTNGYAAFGRNADISLARNWTIPSPLGPNNMLAVYWDELHLVNTSDILYHYDTIGGRLIIEWYDMRHHSNNYSSTFELIIYNQETCPTWSGDNVFTFQYNHVEHSTGGMEYDIPYWTTGIENAMQNDGLLISYLNQYTAGSATVEEGRAILFTTNVNTIFGYLEGTITETGSATPIEGAWIGTDNPRLEAVTDVNGHFFIDSVQAGRVLFDIEAECHNYVYNHGFTIVEDETLHVNIELDHPEFEVYPLIIADTLRVGQQIVRNLWVRNRGTGRLQWQGYFEMDSGLLANQSKGKSNNPVNNDLNELDEPWGEIYSFELNDCELRYNGIEFDGEYFWLTGSNNLDTSGPNYLYKYSREGSLIDTYEQPVAAENRSAFGMYGLSWDGEYLYGADNGIIYKMQFSEDSDQWVSVSTCQSPVRPVRYIASNPDNGELFIGSFRSDIFVVHMDSTNALRQFEQDYNPRGAMWYPEDQDGYFLYIMASVTDATHGNVIKMDPETGDTMHVMQYELSGYIETGACITSEWNTQLFACANILAGTQSNWVQLWGVSTPGIWINLPNDSGSVAPDDSQQVRIELSAGDLPADNYEVYICFDHDACIADENRVHVVLSVTDLDVEQESVDSSLPSEWTFDAPYPNPFNPSTTISYSLKKATDVRLCVYNLLGQEVARLVDNPMQAGQHRLTFDGANLASGIYFLHLNAGPLQETRKIILMK